MDSLEALVALNAASAKGQPKDGRGRFSSESHGIAATQSGANMDWKIEGKPQEFTGKTAPHLTGLIIDTPGHSPARKGVEAGSTGISRQYKDGRILVATEKRVGQSRIITGHGPQGHYIEHTIAPNWPVRVLGRGVPKSQKPDTPSNDQGSLF
jgi:hypothetical protein